MSVALLIVSHHNIGKALVEAVETSFAHQLPLTLAYVDVPSTGNPDELKLRVKKAIANLDEGDGVLILTDLYGSTPANICRDNLESGQVHMVTGLNLPMILGAMNYPQLSLVEMASNAVKAGQSGIVDCGPAEAKDR
jgi:PTS system ascorbate-specific IIA component